jgi:hypothetical protein
LSRMPGLVTRSGTPRCPLRGRTHACPPSQADRAQGLGPQPGPQRHSHAPATHSCMSAESGGQGTQGFGPQLGPQRHSHAPATHSCMSPSSGGQGAQGFGPQPGQSQPQRTSSPTRKRSWPQPAGHAGTSQDGGRPLHRSRSRRTMRGRSRYGGRCIRGRRRRTAWGHTRLFGRRELRNRGTRKSIPKRRRQRSAPRRRIQAHKGGKARARGPPGSRSRGSTPHRRKHGHRCTPERMERRAKSHIRHRRDRAL